jgi:chromosome segregation ATPase
MSWNDHDHRGEYAETGHDHYDYAERHHRHYDDESTVHGLREDLGRAEERIRDLEAKLDIVFERIAELEQVVSVHGETLDGVRNRVYALEHSTALHLHRYYDPEEASP